MRMNGLISSAALTTAIVAGAALVSSSTNASPITVTNYSFLKIRPQTTPGRLMAPAALALRQFRVGLIPGFRIRRPILSGQHLLRSDLLNYVPDGIVVASSNGGTFSQTVSATAVAGVTYTLQVDIGHRNDNFYVTPTVELLIGSNIFTAIGSAPTIGNWATWTATDTALAGDAGAPISIVLIANGVQGDFDNVRLADNTLRYPTAIDLVDAAQRLRRSWLPCLSRDEEELLSQRPDQNN